MMALDANVTFTTTVRLQADADYAAHANVLPIPDMLPSSRYRLQDELRLFILVIRAALRARVLLVNGCRGRFKPELLAVLLSRLLPGRYRPRVVLYGDMFHQHRGLRGALQRLALRLVDQVIDRYVVITEAESQLFPQLWRVDPQKMRVCPYFLETARHPSAQAGAAGDHIFAGGNSFRNYEPLLAAARRLPAYQFILCTGRLNGRTDLPPNVTASLVTHQRYVELIETAAAVIIPLQTDLHRVAGLQTALDALWLRKPTIITDALGVREYVQHHQTGLVVDGTVGGYVDAIRWIMHPANANAVRQMGQQARASLEEQFTLHNHVQRLLTVIAEVSS